MSNSHESIQTVENLLHYFREELLEAFDEVDIEPSEETEAYLVHLLEGFTRLNPDSASEVGFDKPAAFYLGEALNSPGDRRIETYRRLGDASLFNCGFFEGYLTRRLVDSEYYEDVGRVAYQKLSVLMDNRSKENLFRAVYAELATNFDDMVDAFKWLGANFKQSDDVTIPEHVVDAIASEPGDGSDETESLQAAGLFVASDDEQPT